LRLLDQLLELARLIHINANITSADELAVDVQLEKKMRELSQGQSYKTSHNEGAHEFFVFFELWWGGLKYNIF